MKKPQNLKTLTFFALISALLFFSLSGVNAHAPESVHITYNLEREELSVTVNHNVDDPNSHYVNRISIYVNLTLDQQEIYHSQQNPTSFTQVFELSVGIGSEIEVIAYCNLGGETSATMIVRETGEISGYSLLTLVGISALTLGILQKRRRT